MLKRFKRIFTAIVSAALCVSMALGITASAADADVWKETKALTSLKYNSNYIKWAEKYSEKDAKNTVTYEKSRTKKFLDRLQKEAAKESPEYILGLIDSENMLCCAFKENGFKTVVYINDECTVIYLADNALTLMSTTNKTMASIKVDDDETVYFNEIAAEYSAKSSETIAEIMDFDISENAKGKLFKFKSKEKIYYYEEFETESIYGDAGFLFTEKGTPIAMCVSGSALCVSFKTKVDDSEFDIPKGYKTVDFDDFEY